MSKFLRILIPILALGILVLWVVAFVPSQLMSSRRSDITALSVDATPTAQPTPLLQQATAAEIWSAMQESIPFPYTLALPSDTFTPIDGVYVKQEPAGILLDHVHCRRCPDWLYEPGVWKLRFSQGAYRILQTDSNWRTMGSYVVSGERLLLFNDPTCLEDTRKGEFGLYQWKKEKGILTLQVIDDPCAILLRGKNLAHLPWQSCQPPNIEAAITDHWLKPMGCE